VETTLFVFMYITYFFKEILFYLLVLTNGFHHNVIKSMLLFYTFCLYHFIWYFQISTEVGKNDLDLTKITYSWRKRFLEVLSGQNDPWIFFFSSPPLAWPGHILLATKISYLERSEGACEDITVLTTCPVRVGSVLRLRSCHQNNVKQARCNSGRESEKERR
jgi:hypothetical protein